MAKGWTVQQLIDEEFSIWAFCHNWRCHHRAKLNLQTLKAKLGPDASTMHDDLVPKLKCQKCGGKEVGLTLIPRDKPPNPFEGWKWR